METRVLILSDISFGHGVPQLVYLAESILQSPGATVRMIEPDMKGTLELTIPGAELVREITLLPPNHPSFAVDYARACRDHIEQFRPDVVIATSGFMVLATTTASWRRFRTIYYAFEDKRHQVSLPPYSSEMLCEFMEAEACRIIVPEENRASIDYPDAVREGKVIVVYNTSPSKGTGERTLPAFRFDEQLYLKRNPDVAASVADRHLASGAAHYRTHGRREMRPLGTRNPADCRFLMAGTLDRRSLLHAFLDPNIEGIQADVFGAPSGPEAETILREACQRHPGIRYGGLIPNAELRRISPNYAYRLVLWSDIGVNELFACPNKLFEAIADGTPVIATPQPQIHEVVSTWGCGLLARDWEAASAAETIQLGRILYETEIYDQLLFNAEEARRNIGWQREFEKIRDFIVPPARKAKARSRQEVRG